LGFNSTLGVDDDNFNRNKIYQIDSRQAELNVDGKNADRQARSSSGQQSSDDAYVRSNGMIHFDTQHNNHSSLVYPDHITSSSFVMTRSLYMAK